MQKPIDKISGQGEREWGVGIDTKKALPYTWEKIIAIGVVMLIVAIIFYFLKKK